MHGQTALDHHRCDAMACRVGHAPSIGFAAREAADSSPEAPTFEATVTLAPELFDGLGSFQVPFWPLHVRMTLLVFVWSLSHSSKVCSILSQYPCLPVWVMLERSGLWCRDQLQPPSRICCTWRAPSYGEACFWASSADRNILRTSGCP